MGHTGMAIGYCIVQRNGQGWLYGIEARVIRDISSDEFRVQGHGQW